MNVLVLGSGGREHALAWRLSQDPSCTKIFVWPGNPGMLLQQGSQKKINLLNEAFNKESLQKFISTQNIRLVIPGAEKFLYQGVGDWCKEWAVACFGPTTQAASLERSKLFSKKIMNDARIPTARFVDISEAFTKNEDLREVVASFKLPVIKISGPSLGKGVFVCKSSDEALKVLEEIRQNPPQGLEEGIFIEEGLDGKEVSLFYACHEDKFLFLGAAQDHKRLLDDDQGPNTGGMGTISPVPWADREFIDMATSVFLAPTLKRMKEIGSPFSGVLFLGLMVGSSGSALLEYNVRFGDPETQVILPLIEGDFASILYNLCTGEPVSSVDLKKDVAVHVVKAARGYPGTFGGVVEKGQVIKGSLDHDDQSIFFFAGVRKVGDDLLTDGGRVFGVTAWAQDKARARIHAYKKIEELSFAGEQFRTDIGAKL